MDAQTLLIAIKARDDASSILGGVGGAIGKLGLAAAAAGAGIAAGLVVGVKAAGDLQQSVANISTIKPDIDTSAVFASLNALSTRVPQSAKELGDGLYNVFSSIDVSQEQALGLLETFAKGAVGASTDAETFGTAALGVLNAYGLAAEDAGHISDVFFNTVNKGVITGDELAANLGLVTQSAKLAGVDLDSLGGFIAGVTKEGGPAAQNMNNLNNLFQKITTKEAALAMHNLGIATTDATGNFLPQIDVLSDLKDRLAGMTESARSLALQKIFPDLQARAGASVILDQLDFVKAAIEDNKASAGSAEAAYAKMSATFNSQTKLLGNAFTAMLTTFGAGVLPVITPVITAFASALPGAMAQAGQAIEGVKAQVGGGLQGIAETLAATGAAWAPWAAQAGPAGDAVSAALTGVSGIAQSLQLLLQGNFSGAWVTAGAAMGDFGAAADAVRAAFEQLLPQVDRDEIWKTLGEEISILGEAFGILGEAFGQIGDEMNTGGESAVTFGSVMNGLATIGKDVAIVIREIAVIIRDTITVLIAISSAIDVVSAAMNRVTAAMTDAMRDGFSKLVAAATAAGQTLQELGAIAGIAFDQLGTSARAGLDQLGTTIGSFFDGLGSSVQAGLAAIQGFFAAAWSAIPEDIRADLEVVSGLIVQDLGVWLASMTSGMAEIGASILSGWTAVTTAVGTAMSDIGTAVQNGWTAITGTTNTSTGAMTTDVQGAWDTITAAASTAWNGVSTVIGGALDAALLVVSTWVTNVVAKVTGMAGEMLAAGKAAGQSAVDGLVAAITGGIGSVGNAAASLARSALQAMKSALPGPDPHSPWPAFVALGETIPEGLVEGMTSKNPAVKAAAQELARQAQIAIQVAAPVDSFLVVGQDMGEGIALGLLRGVDKAKSAAGTYGESILGELQSFTQKVDGEIQTATNKLADISAAASKAMQSALDKESDSIDASIAKMQSSLDSLYAGRALDADTSGRKGALSATLAQETLAHNAVAAAQEMAYQHTQDLGRAQLKFDSDIAAATTAVKRKEIEAQYADQLARIDQSFVDAQGAAKHRDELAAAERVFRAGQDARTKALDDALAGEALARQITSIIEGQAIAATAAEQTRKDTIAAAQLTADAQRIVLLRSYDQRIEDLKTAFLSKIPELEGPALDAFNAFMDNITGKTVAMGTAISASLGDIGTAATGALGNVVPDAFAVTDKAVEEFDDTWGTSWDEARATLEAGANALVESAGHHIPAALTTAGNAAKATLGTGGVLPLAAAQSTKALADAGAPAIDPLIARFNMLKDAAIRLGKDGFGVALNAAKAMEGQFPGLTKAVTDWIATLGGIPTSITTEIITHYSKTGQFDPQGSTAALNAAGYTDTPAGRAAYAAGGPKDFGTGGSAKASGGDTSNKSPFPDHIGESGPGGKYNDPSTGHPYTRAGGGPVSAGTLYEINENRRGSHGVELFMPAMNGSISPHGGGDASGGGWRFTREDARMIAEELARVIPSRIVVDDIQSSLVRLGQRNGGVVGLA